MALLSLKKCAFILTNHLGEMTREGGRFTSGTALSPEMASLDRVKVLVLGDSGKLNYIFRKRKAVQSM